MQPPHQIASGSQPPGGRSDPAGVPILRKSKSLQIAMTALMTLAGQSSVDAGSIAGEVRFIGAPPKRDPVKITKDQDYCGLTIPNETYVIGTNGGLKNVVVFIEQAPTASLPAQRERVLDNKGCRFVPRVMAMIVGERLIVKNSDPKLHIVHPYLEERTVFTLSLPFRGQHLEVTHRIKSPGLLHVRCDAHAWMHGYIHVFEHAYFAVTSESGDFSIVGIPEGKYTLNAWHEAAGIQTKDVTVGPMGQMAVSFDFAAR